MTLFGRWLAMTAVSGILATGPALASTPGLNPMLLGTERPSTGLLKSGLIDLSRLDISHSVSFGTASSSFGTTSGGLWVSSIGYRLSDPLRVAVDLGAVLNTSGDGPFLSEKNLFLRGFELDYRPSRLFQLHIEYQNWPSGIQPVYGNPAFGFGHGSLGSPLGLAR